MKREETSFGKANGAPWFLTRGAGVSAPSRRRFAVRMLMKVTFPVETFNAAVRDGTAGAKMGRILEEIKPEAVYFTDDDGKRSGLLIVDLPHPSKIPALAEPWMLTFNASIELKVAMTPEDLQASGIDQIGARYKS
jgi:hypothetical protein